MRVRGFTLAELLIALAILGVIATFAIPKILQAQQDSKRAAVFKEVYAALSQVDYKGATMDGMTNATYISYFLQNLNGTRICPNNAQAEGCWPGSTDSPNNTATAPGLVMHNGAMINDFEASAGGDGLWLDWNGTAGPNQMCVDQIPVYVVWTTGTYYGASAQAGRVYIWTNPPFTTGPSICPASAYANIF